VNQAVKGCGLWGGGAPRCIRSEQGGGKSEVRMGGEEKRVENECGG